MRKLATIRTVDRVDPIPDADQIEVATVGGAWKVVIGKGNFKAGDQGIYCEIDSWIPTAIDPSLSRGQEPKEYEGIKGERLRTIRLRKQLSQGLLLPMDLLYDSNVVVGLLPKHLCEGADVSEGLGIIKYEAPIPAELNGQAKGALPSVIQHTDQERVQNLSAQIEEWRTRDLTWECTEKLDGTSMTVYLNAGEFGVCGHNWEYLQSETNTYWRVAIANDFERKLRELGMNIALQGELIGEGIQGNKYKLKGQEFFLFDIYLIDEGKCMGANDRQHFAEMFNVKHAPIYNPAFKLHARSVDDLLTIADRQSLLNPAVRQEGWVYKCNEDSMLSFKTVSNAFLMKEKD